MKYLFVREFNPAYDKFLLAYFKEYGLGLDENTTIKELESRVSHFDQGKMSAEELLLTAYMWNWGLHPECRPSLYWLLDKTIGGNGHPDPEKLRQFESKLPPGQGKLLFTKEEAAADITGFYRKYMRNPLKSDIEKGASDGRLAAYFSLKELRPSSVGRSLDEKRRERDEYQIAVDLLSWLEGITSARVSRDLDQIIGEHESNPEHMRESTGGLLGRPDRKRVCEHESEYLKLQVYHHLDDGAVSTFLFPSRGFLISDTVLEEGWNDIVFPQYYVIQDKIRRATSKKIKARILP